MHISFSKINAVQQRFDWGSPQTVRNRVAAGLLPPPVKVFSGDVRWLNHELDQIASAIVAGARDDEIRALVQDLINARQSAAQVARIAAAPGGCLGPDPRSNLDEVVGERP